MLIKFFHVKLTIQDGHSCDSLNHLLQSVTGQLVCMVVVCRHDLSLAPLYSGLVNKTNALGLQMYWVLFIFYRKGNKYSYDVYGTCKMPQWTVPKIL